MHYPLSNGHCAWSILPVGGANGILLGTASWQQAGYTRVGHLGRLARGRPTDTAGCPRPGAQALSPGPGRRGACGAAPFRQALLQGIGGDSRTLRAELFCEGPGMAASRSSMRRAGDHDIALQIYRNNNNYSNATSSNHVRRPQGSFPQALRRRLARLAHVEAAGHARALRQDVRGVVSQ